MATVTRTINGAKVDLEVELRGRPLKGETSEQTFARKVSAAVKAYKAATA